MRRLLMIFLLVLMPLQLSWAAMAFYCQHESGAAAKHVGHHEHQHQANAAEPDHDKTRSIGTVDADCSFCHAYCAVILPDTHDVSPISTASSFDMWHHDDSMSAIPSRPERPNWAAFV